MTVGSLTSSWSCYKRAPEVLVHNPRHQPTSTWSQTRSAPLESYIFESSTSPRRGVSCVSTIQEFAVRTAPKVSTGHEDRGGGGGGWCTAFPVPVGPGWTPSSAPSFFMHWGLEPGQGGVEPQRSMGRTEVSSEGSGLFSWGRLREFFRVAMLCRYLTVAGL